jgi:hypothetical protein
VELLVARMKNRHRGAHAKRKAAGMPIGSRTTMIPLAN